MKRLSRRDLFQAQYDAPVIAFEEASMTFDYTLAAIVTAALLAYLTYALLRPERF